MKFIEDGGRKRLCLPALARPCERSVIHSARGSVDSIRLPRRAGIGHGLAAVKYERIIDPYFGDRYFGVPPTALTGSHGEKVGPNSYFDLACVWRPKTE